MKNLSVPRLIVRLKLFFASKVFRNLGHATDQAKKKTTLISMVKNEKDILEAFCRHVVSLFDRIILIDHLSSDGTSEYIKVLSEIHSNVEYYCFDEPGYYQSELMTWAAKILVERETPGWVFFLDADEFLPFKSKEEFDQKLSELALFPVISMPWLNLVPLDMDSGKVVDQLFLQPRRPSLRYKIAFQPNLIPTESYFIAQGNHKLFIRTGASKVKFPAKRSFPIYHLPIRTKQQLRDKIRYGVESYRQMGDDNKGKNGFHWVEINRIVETTSLTDEIMAGIVANYSESLNAPYERSFDELRKNGYSELRLEICVSPLGISFAEVEGDKHVEGQLSDEPNGNKNGRKINFDRSTRSVVTTK